jgi:type VI secretion system secreted protein VgrG
VEISTNKYRYLNGVVTRFEHGGAVGRFDIYHLEMRPWLWHLTLGADCRIFQDKSVTEILDTVFSEYGSSSQIEKKGLTGTFRKRPFTVQYRESDFAFVSRLMEEEGIYYYFKHEKDKHTLVLCNGPSGHAAIEGETLGWAAKQLGDHLREDVVTQWSRAHSLRPLKYTHTDFSPDAPSVDLRGTALRSASYPKPNDLEVFDYPGGYEDLAMDGSSSAKRTEGERLAKLRVDAFESGHVVATGLTPYRHMAAGVTFSLSDHPDAGGYLVTRVAYEMEYSGYEANDDTVAFDFDCRFTAVPKDIKFQPQPVSVRPTVQGPQTATVVGPSGDEIHTDKFGRVKLQFHWDRIGKKNEKSSCYVRVSHPWASKQFGMIALPRIGDEVVVEFLEGNPDRPLVTGRVYNGTNMPPYALPAQQTVSGIKSQSSKGGGLSNANELRFDDKKGSEYVWFQAEKDFHRLVKHVAFDSVGNDLWVDIGKNASHTVGENVAVAIGKAATISVGTDTHASVGGDLNTDVGGALSLNVEDNVAAYGRSAVTLTVGGELDVDVGRTAKLTVANSLHIKGMGVVIDGGTQLTIKAGGSFVTLGPEGVSIKGAMVMINSGGSPGTARGANKASLAKPKKPAKAKENKDPLAN